MEEENVNVSANKSVTSASEITDVSDFTDISEITDVSDFDFTDISEITDASDFTNISEITDDIAVTDATGVSDVALVSGESNASGRSGALSKPDTPAGSDTSRKPDASDKSDTPAGSGKSGALSKPDTPAKSGKSGTSDLTGNTDSGEMTDNADIKSNRRSEILSWVIIIASAFVFAFVINRVFLLRTVITSGSMRPTMEIGEHVIANRLAYLFNDPQRGDMVFFANPENENEIYVKRIIGLPGDKVEIKKGKVYINDSEKALKEPYLFEKAEKLDFGPFNVPENCYFMLGDNRNISNDSRFWNIHYVSKDKIYGKALFGYRVRLMKSAEY